METKKGVSLVIYDDNGSYYFLIFHRVKDWEGWEFPKTALHEGESMQDAALRCIKEETGLSQYKIIGKLDSVREFEKDGVNYSYEIFIVEASMNIPVRMSKEAHDTYYWGQGDRILEKLTWDNEKDSFKKAIEAMKARKSGA